MERRKGRPHLGATGLTFGFREDIRPPQKTFSKVDRNLKLCSGYAVRFKEGLEPWQVYTIVTVLGIMALTTICVVAREIWYAVHPDKRPKKPRK
jgi:hypothetical protein